MIRTYYLCDYVANKECKNRKSCAFVGDGYCKHTADRSKSLHYKKGEPSSVELRRRFEVVEDNRGFAWWEVIKK